MICWESSFENSALACENSTEVNITQFVDYESIYFKAVDNLNAINSYLRVQKSNM